MYGLKKLNIAINRKMLADMAVNNPQSFDQLVQRVKEVV
jgi:large subunit ribosomal protein L20